MVKVAKTYRNDEERLLLIALITSDSVLEKVAGLIKGEKNPFRSKWSNYVGQWCLDHFQKYGKAPRKAIQSFFSEFVNKSRDTDTIETIESLLSGLSQEAETKDLNESYLLDLATRYFRKVRLEQTLEELEVALDKEDLSEAESVLTAYNSVVRDPVEWIDPTNANEVLESLQEKEQATLLHFRGDLDTFLSPFMERDAFIAFVGPEKRGKSFWLMEMAWQAWIQRRRVLYYIVGDMSRKQVMRRLVTRAVRRPLRSGTLEYPRRLKKKDEEQVEVRCQTREYSDPVSYTAAVATMKNILERTGSSKSRLKLRCCGGAFLTASDVERDVKSFIRQGWIPDVIVLDYADLLAPETFTRTMEYRHQVNESWKIMRRIAADHHLLFITGTQAAATSYNSAVIRKTDFSEDKRKNAHVTGMVGINQTTQEKKQGIYRLNWVFLRDGEWTDTQVVWTAGNLSLACPCIVSLL